MHREERKRDKRLPPPGGEIQNIRNNPHHEAAPFYTEDLVSYDNQENYGQHLILDPRSSSNLIRINEDLGPWDSYKPDHKEIQNLKEKCAILDAELQHSKAKLSFFERENEKLQEALNESISDRRTSVLELETKRLIEENEIKSKQNESLERTLKIERVKFCKDLDEIKNQIKSLKENYQDSKPVFYEKNEEVDELREENKNLKFQIESLQDDIRQMSEKHQEELEEQYTYFQQLLEDKNNEEQAVLQIEKENSEEKKSETSEKSEKNQIFAYNEVKTEVKIEEKQESFSSNEYFKQIDDTYKPKIEETGLETLVPDKKTMSTISQSVFQEPDPVPIRIKNQDLTSLFDSAPTDENASMGFPSIFNNPTNQISGLFDSKVETIDLDEEISEEKPTNWFTAEPKAFDYTAQNDDIENATNFFSSLGDQQSNKFQSIPRSLFD